MVFIGLILVKSSLEYKSTFFLSNRNCNNTTVMSDSSRLYMVMTENIRERYSHNQRCQKHIVIHGNKVLRVFSCIFAVKTGLLYCKLRRNVILRHDSTHWMKLPHYCLLLCMEWIEFDSLLYTGALCCHTEMGIQLSAISVS